MSIRSKNTASVMSDEEAAAMGASAPSSSSDRSTPPKVQWVNIANLAAYFVNVLLVYGVQAYANLPSDADQSTKFQTLVTPAPYAFAIWAVIFPAELIWAVAQMFPAYRSNELVVQGVGFSFVLTCIAQASWSILFSTQNITWSLVAMLTILFSLIMILWNTSKVLPTTTPPARPPTSILEEGESHAHISHHTHALGEYWLLKFPFELHAAWIMAASVLNINVVLVAWKVSADARLVVAWFSLFIVAGVALSFLIHGDRLRGNSQWVVPGVMAWAAYAIGKGLGNPNDLISDTFDANDIHTVKVGAFVVAALIILALHVKALYDYLLKPSPPLSDYMEAYHRLEENESE